MGWSVKSRFSDNATPDHQRAVIAANICSRGPLSGVVDESLHGRCISVGVLVSVHELALGYVYELGLVLWHERRRSWALEHTSAARDQRFGSS